MKKVHILRPPRQHQRTNDHAHDPALDLLITNHRRRHAHRFDMLGIRSGDLLARHMRSRTTTTTNTWSTK